MRRVIIAAAFVLWGGLALAGFSGGFGDRGGFSAPVVTAACTPSSLSLDFTTGSFPPTGVTTANSTGGSGHNDVGTYFNSSNVLTVNSAGGLRADYMQVGSTRTMLYEPAATNLLVRSNAFTTSPWFTNGGTVPVAAQATSPDGTNDGWLASSGTGFGSVDQQLTVTAIPYAVSVWAKLSVSAANLQFYISGTGSSNEVTTTSWVRDTFTTTATAGAGKDLLIGFNNGAGSVYLMFGAQFETGAVATSYIPTAASAVTRAADTATFTVPSCAGHITVTFDNNATQSIAVSPGSYTLTTTLTRPNIKSIVGAT